MWTVGNGTTIHLVMFDYPSQAICGASVYATGGWFEVPWTMAQSGGSAGYYCHECSRKFNEAVGGRL